MAQVINTNVGALFAGAALNKSAVRPANRPATPVFRPAHQQCQRTMRPAWPLPPVMTRQVRGTNIAIRNANDAISKAQTNDGYGAQITENLQRLYEIAVQLGGTATGAETTALLAENSRIARPENGFNIRCIHSLHLLLKGFNIKSFRKEQVGEDSEIAP